MSQHFVNIGVLECVNLKPCTLNSTKVVHPYKKKTVIDKCSEVRKVSAKIFKICLSYYLSYLEVISGYPELE